jgi:DNA repair protein RadC
MKPSKAIQSLISPRNRKRLPENVCDIARLSIDDMLARGLSIGDARTIHSAIALAREIAEPQSKYRTIRITSPATAMQYCLAEFRALACQAVQEEFWMVSLDTKNQPINKHQVTVGTLRNSLVHPREVFRPAISDAANCILVVHNHPSGDPTPSDQDLSITERLESASEIIGIPVIDHIVVAGEKAISIQEWRSGNRWC